MQKECSRCGVFKSLDRFTRRALSPDGYTAACKSCLNTAKLQLYWTAPDERAKTLARVTKNKAARFDRDPAYKRAFNLWGSTKRRPTKIPPWVAIADFVPICRVALLLGDEFQLDHEIPIKHPLVCGLHVPANVRVLPVGLNQTKRNDFKTDWHESSSEI